MKTLKLLLIGAALSGLTCLSQAAFINGSIGFTGLYTQNGGTNGVLNTATSMSITSASILSATGDLTGATAPFSFLTPVDVNAGIGSLVGKTLWTATVGGKLFSLVISSASQNLTTADQLNLLGNGTINDGAGGFDATSGIWQLGFGNSGQSFTWQSTSATVPEGGSAIAMIGFALLGLVASRRFFVRA